MNPVKFKTIYFPDYGQDRRQRSGLTIGFGQDDERLFAAVSRLSSFTLRRVIGFSSFRDLQAAATRGGLSASAFVRSRLGEAKGLRDASGREEDAALQATFVGGRGSPLHDWFPYLEGYSPDFVSSVLETRMPEATSVFDPFCGSGTTALTGAGMGLRAEYCEVNPVCRTVIEAKAMARSSDDRRRAALAETLDSIAKNLRGIISEVAPAGDLNRAFTLAFGVRPFFDEETFSSVLRLRTVVDRLAKEDADAARLLEVAVLGALVNNSLLIRRGDLRFRTQEELARHRPDIAAEVEERVHRIASDLLDLQTMAGTVALACENVRDLRPANGPGYEAVVTSPPYLNGTNYFRNTKIELWFSRHLRSKQELRAFRDAAITAGINDVTSGKTGARPVPAVPLLASTLERLRRSAYDQRIPMMVSSYFSEMSEATTALRGVTHAHGRVAIDLGDSAYGGVHVPTDIIVRALMEDAGFNFIHEVVLRERQSRAGTPLRQTLQLFEAA